MIIHLSLGDLIGYVLITVFVVFYLTVALFAHWTRKWKK